jgi:hypothetical protein
MGYRHYLYEIDRSFAEKIRQCKSVNDFISYDVIILQTTASQLLCEHSLLDLPKTIVPAEGGREDG